MNEFRLHTPDGDVLTFCGREPEDRALPIEAFTVRLELASLTASAKVWGGYSFGHPTELFAAMAARWRGWTDELAWESVEGELELGGTHDGHGHVALRVELRPDAGSDYWRVHARIRLEPGKLDEIARAAAVFFGAPKRG